MVEELGGKINGLKVERDWVGLVTGTLGERLTRVTSGRSSKNGQ